MRTGTTFKAVAIIGFKDGQGGVEHLTLGHDHDIKPGRDVVTTENLSYQSFCSVSLNGSAELFRRRDAQAPHRPVVGQNEHGCVAPVNPCAAFIDFLKLGAAADVFMRPEPRQMSLFAADGQALTPFRAAAFEHQPPVFRAHPHEKPVRLRPVAGIRLERALPFHAFTPDSEPTMLATASESVNGSGLCYSLRPSSGPQGAPKTCTFGLFPEFSTPVEKAVENRVNRWRTLIESRFPCRNEPLGRNPLAGRNQGEQA